MTAVLRGEGLSEASWNEIFKPQVRIRSRTQVGPGASETTSVNDPIELSYGLGWGLQRTPYGWGAFKEGHGDGFQHYSIVYPAKKLGVLLMSNSDNAESIFGHLLRLTIADTFTPLWNGCSMIGRRPGHPTIPKGFLPSLPTTVFPRTSPSAWSLGAKTKKSGVWRTLSALPLGDR
jgi:CubicO group peptidase (beta-lactamase class C family)